MLSALLLATFTTCSMPMPMLAQDPVEFGRLATEQRQVAEQLRRLESLLEVLEKRDREQGRVERADLLKQAAEHLAAAEGSGDLAAVVEGLAREIGAMHSGNALEGQQKLISVLQELLDFLILSERREQEALQMKELQERLQALENFISEQQQLLQETQELASKSQESSEELEKLRRELAELQAEFAEDLEAFNREQQRESSRKSEDSEKAQDAAEDAARELREQSAETQPQSSSEQLCDAIEKQQQALSDLQKAKAETEKKIKQAKQSELDEILLDVEKEAERLLSLHQAVHLELQEIAVQVGDQVVPRNARAKLRKAAAMELELSYAATKMMTTIDQAGADSFPYFINMLAQDHIRLSKDIGPPRYYVKTNTLRVSEDLVTSWLSLIDAIRTERERIRLQLEQQPLAGQDAPNEEEDSPLVGFALELQLLKRMQNSIANQLSLMTKLQEAYQQAGLEMGPEELGDLEQLLSRQKSLQLQFETMVERMSGLDNKDQAEDM